MSLWASRSIDLLADALDDELPPRDSDKSGLVGPCLVGLLLAECDASVWHASAQSERRRSWD